MDNKSIQRINFYVMREMWQVIRGKNRKGLQGYTIHDSLGMSRPRFERFINGGGTSIPDAELTKLQMLTSVNRDVFDGKKLLASVDTSDIKGWITFSDKHMAISNDAEATTFNLNEFKKKIIETIKQSERKKDNTDFQAMWQFISGYTPRGVLGVVELTDRLRELTFKELESIVDNDTLENFLGELTSTHRMVSTLIQYKKYTDNR